MAAQKSRGGRTTVKKSKPEKAKRPKKKAKAKKAPKVKVRLVDAEFEDGPDEAETLGAKVKKKLGGYVDKLIETAENDPDKLVIAAQSLLTNTERLVKAVKENPGEAKTVMRNGLITLAARLMRQS